MADYDQGGVVRETSHMYLGPSVGWTRAPAPVGSQIRVTTGGVTVVSADVTLVRVAVASPVTLNLPSAKGSIAGAGTVPGTWVQDRLTICDSGGNAGSNTITIQPVVGETINGAGTATISSNYGVVNLIPDVQNGSWVIG